jgi:NodT family efflux transporter outer membrane factor (OMF) lipoprotein
MNIPYSFYRFQLRTILRFLTMDILWVVMLVGCVSGPDFKLPAQGVSVTQQHAVPPTPIGTSWWQQFGSPKLNALIEEALQSNPSLEASRATLHQAEQIYAAQAGSTLYPQVGVGLGSGREHFNAASLGLPISNTFNLYNASIGVSYNLDLAGGNHRILEALAAQIDYQRFQLDGARLTVLANVTTGAIAQAHFSAQIAASEKILALQIEQLDITRKRLTLGNASMADVYLLQTQVEQTRASIVPPSNRLEQTNHLLAVLVGKSPEDGHIPQFILSDFTLPTNLPLHIPSELVHQRPDIQASEALLHVANAQYGLAISRLYPQLTLSSNLGSLTNASLFSPGSLIWGIASQVTQPLFDAGLKPAANAAEAGFNAAAANYRQTVLQALQNVADVLRTLDNDAQALHAQTAADTAALRSLELVQLQYHLGTASYLQLLIAQQQEQQTRISLIAAHAQQLTDSAALYQSIGGHD